MGNIYREASIMIFCCWKFQKTYTTPKIHSYIFINHKRRSKQFHSHSSNSSLYRILCHLSPFKPFLHLHYYIHPIPRDTPASGIFPRCAKYSLYHSLYARRSIFRLICRAPVETQRMMNAGGALMHSRREIEVYDAVVVGCIILVSANDK